MAEARLNGSRVQFECDLMIHRACRIRPETHTEGLINTSETESGATSLVVSINVGTHAKVSVVTVVIHDAVSSATVIGHGRARSPEFASATI